MPISREIRQFPELAHLTEEQQQEILSAARQDVFGPDVKLERWRGNIVNFSLMFAVSALFTAWLAPALSIKRDDAALIMLLFVLPAFFILQHKRYQTMLRRALRKRLEATDTKKAP
ncbi:hypothetical protein [Gilvimarinus chinensis]|uniref:hypothetical protein n=1 Tax=Gilvimarinus chinensis TaxID=396005 RepID=UPI0003766939|nr:hypothetical protein [Gilvimarinus chinensis]